MVTPSRKYFCREKNRTNMGSAEMVAPAIMGESRVPLANLKVFKPTWMVYMDSREVTRKGQKKVFQLPMKVLMAI